ncbi:MAG: hypothetical protein K2N23_07995 [Clostridia bacterium]|nr:hypothetical protein [Clostridia bacterium]
MDCGTIDGDVLTINNNAQLGSRIEIIASADGVDSTEPLIVIVKKVDVKKVDIKVENNIDSIAPEGIAQFSAEVYPNNATETIITYSIVGEGRNIAIMDAVSGILTVSPVQLITRGDMEIQVIATADGVSSDPVSLHVNVPITDITMYNRDITAKRGDYVQLSSGVNYNATYKDVEYHFWDGSNISDKNQYGTIDGDTLHISKNILIPNAELTIVAIPHGAENMDVMSDACVVRVNIPVESVSLTSNKTTIIIGESATLSTSIFPVFASDRTIKYQFVDNLGNITSKPLGIAFDGDTINVADDLALLTSTPRFMVCAFVGGVASNIWRFDVIERVVTELTFDMDALQKIYCSDTQTYEVHPYSKYEDLIKASVNSDASYKGITFSVITGNTDIDNIDCAESQRFDGLSYYVTLQVIKHAAVGDVITILAQSQRNPQIRAELRLTITGIYADEIVGANISATDSRGANCITILDGKEFVGNLNGYTSNYINPGDTVRINNLYFDDEIVNDEIVNKYYKNVTYDDNYSVVYSDQRFISVTEKGFTVLALDEILKYLTPLDDHFTATVIFKQADGRTLTKDFTFYIFVGVRTVQYIDGIDANGTTFEMTDCQKLYVDRNHETAHNSFTFRFSINNGTFTTNRLLLVNNITEADIHDNEFKDTLSATGNDFLNGKTLPQITFKEDRANSCNVINIKFNAMYNVGTVFKVALLNPDHAADRKLLFSFSLHIKPVNESNEFTFGSDGIYKAGVGITDPGGSAIKKSYEVKYQEGPTVINEVSEYADLRVGYAVQLKLGDQRNDLGQVWQFNEEESYHIGIDFPEDSPWGDFIIRADTDAKDSVYTGKLAKLVFDYSDGAQELRSVVYIRIVKLLELQSKSTLRGDNNDNHPRDLVWDMEEGIVFGESADKRITYLEPDYKLYHTDKGNLSASLKDDGKTLVVTDPNVFEICKIKYNYKQFYNGVEIKVEDEETHELERRFIANKEQLLNMKNDFISNACGEVRLIADIDLSDKSNVDLGELVVDFNGNGHTLSNIKYSIGSQKLKHAEYHGLFNKIMKTAGVRNLNLRNVTATSGKRHNGSFYYFGALAYENYGTIVNVNIKGESKINIERQASSVGGIVSINRKEATILFSHNYASIRGSGDIGGIAGQNEGTIEGCYNGGDIAIVYESSRSIGGIVGYNHGEGNVIKCNNGGHISSVNTIKGHINVGAIIGHNAANFDGTGWVGSFHVTYTSYDGFIFGWGAYDNGTYLFAYYGYRVGKNK